MGEGVAQEDPVPLAGDDRRGSGIGRKPQGVGQVGQDVAVPGRAATKPHRAEADSVFEKLPTCTTRDNPSKAASALVVTRSSACRHVACTPSMATP